MRKTIHFLTRGTKICGGILVLSPDSPHIIILPVDPVEIEQLLSLIKFNNQKSTG